MDCVKDMAAKSITFEMTPERKICKRKHDTPISNKKIGLSQGNNDILQLLLRSSDIYNITISENGSLAITSTKSLENSCAANYSIQIQYKCTIYRDAKV